MCGITGAISLSPRPLDVERLKGMCDIIAHRGPDDAGYLLMHLPEKRSKGEPFLMEMTDDAFSHINIHLTPWGSAYAKRERSENGWHLMLGHRRLSIIDLTPTGHQPMSDRSKGIWITYNGEIYNFKEIKEELKSKGYPFFSTSDTETIINAYREWGIDCVNHFNGMFAFALWDSGKKRLHIVRDRYGIKPLYYMEQDELLIFGSEIKSILKYLPENPKVDLLALNEYFSFQNILSDRTFFEGIKLLPAGHYLTIDPINGKIDKTQYWDFDFTAQLNEPEDMIQERLYHLIDQAVRRQCVSDVPIGSYLSGGMDSGTVTAITSSVFGRICTFTGGFDLSEAAEHELTFDERELAEKMATTFKTEHYECVLHYGDMETVMDELIWHLEDLRVGQCYPNYFIARLAGKFVKVVMSGMGGDELFGGYPWRYAAAIGDNHDDYIQNYYLYWKRLVSNKEKLSLFNPDIISQLRGLNDNGGVPFKNHTLEVFKRVFPHNVRTSDEAQQVNNSLYFECKTFLHGLFVVEDKLSMAHSLETRVPFLDNDLVDFALQVPVSLKVDGLDNIERIDENVPRKMSVYHKKIDKGKNILRNTMERILPSEITGAKKQGFSAPDESWFRGRSEGYVRELLLNGNARINEYLNPEFVKSTLELHSQQKENKRLLIWSLLSFEKWLDIFK